MMRRFWIAGLLVAFLACSGKDDRATGIVSVSKGGRNSIEESGGKGGSGGSVDGRGGAGAAVNEGGGSGEGGEGGDGGGSPTDERAPSVEITSPAALSDPNDGAVVAGDTVSVTCIVKRSQAPGAADIDDASVKVALLDADGKTVREIAGALNEDPTEFTALFQIAQIPAGKISFRCVASDRAATPNVGTATISTFIDRGPLIEAIQPLPTSAHPLMGAVAFEFSVKPDELVSGDDGAAVGDVSLEVDGKNITSLKPAPNRPGIYVASVDFLDTGVYPMPPTGNIGVTLRAKNSRQQPGPVQREVGYNFTLDGTPPVVTITSPADQRVLQDSLVLSFTITDPIAGVDPASVHVTLNSSADYALAMGAPEMWQSDGNKYTFTIDKSKIPDAISQVHVTVQASDLAGNGPATDSVLVNFDEQPPFVSLDPPNIRVLYDEPSALRCSTSFDPVGSEAANDLEVIPEFKMVRAFVWDLTNAAPSQKVLYYAGVNPTQTYLYVRSDIDKPLIVDTDGDDICDSLADDAESLKGIAHLDAVPPAGSANLSPPNLTDQPDVSGASCSATTTDHKALCAQRSSDLEIAIDAANPGQSAGKAALYAAAVGSSSSLSCTGSQLDFKNLAKNAVGEAPDGWICVVVAAMDDVGNKGISRPLRLCLDAETTAGKPDCATMSTEPPSCTDGCAPPSFSLAGDKDGHPLPFLLEYRE